MDPIKCFAAADTTRAIVALVAPVLAVATGIIALGNKANGVTDYFRLLGSGEISWFGQGAGWIALVYWVARYFPPAWSALWNGPCLAWGDGENLHLSNGKRIPLANIRGVRVQRDFVRQVALFDTNDGRVSLPLLFVRRASDPLLRSLAGARA